MPTVLAQINLSWPTLSVTGVIDILVVAFVIYQLLMIVRGTRAGHVLVGILMLVLAYVVAVWAGLEALHSLLNLHRAVHGAGGHRAVPIGDPADAGAHRPQALVRRRSSAAPESTDEILMAVERLAQDKIGALIVLERDIGLRTFIESGVRLDAVRVARPAALDLPARAAAARRRGDRAEGPHRGGGLLPAAHPESAAFRDNWAPGIAPPSASPKRPTACRWSFPKRPAGFPSPPTERSR